MNRRDFVSGLCWLGASLFVGKEALELGFGKFSSPGPGFVLFWSSLLFAILSIALMVRAVKGKEGSVLLSDLFRGKWLKALIAITALFVYILFLDQVGFLLMTFGFLFLLFTIGGIKPLQSAGSAIVSTLVAYGIFHVALQIQFPRGLLGW